MTAIAPFSGRVVVVGSANVDLVVDVPRHPGPGETILGGELRQSPGGKGANQAVAAARAGGAETTFIGAVGSDSAGDLLLTSLDRGGVLTDCLARVSAPTGTAFISVSTAGENAIVVAPGANSHVVLGEGEHARLASADVVLAQLEVPVEVVVAAAMKRRPDALFVLNAAPSRDLPKSLWDTLDVLVVNEYEAEDLAGLAPSAPGTTVRARAEASAGLLLAKVAAVVVTLGGEGCLVAERGHGTTYLPAPRVVAVDTTGAGDTFCGVLAASLASGAPLVDAAQVATHAAALAVTRHGAQDAVPTADEITHAFRTEPSP